MKLQVIHKKSGVLGEITGISSSGFNVKCKDINGVEYNYVYHSIEDLVEKWEDYKEPEVIYYLSWDGVVLHSADKTGWQDAKQIGNYFETEEEAEKAVEKLKAWKRLKDKGFERVFSLGLRDALCGGETVEFKLLIDDKDLIEDIKLLFGGEE